MFKGLKNIWDFIPNHYYSTNFHSKSLLFHNIESWSVSRYEKYLVFLDDTVSNCFHTLPSKQLRDMLKNISYNVNIAEDITHYYFIISIKKKKNHILAFENMYANRENFYTYIREIKQTHDSCTCSLQALSSHATH